jgi:hypothetical protein
LPERELSGEVRPTSFASTQFPDARAGIVALYLDARRPISGIRPPRVETVEPQTARSFAASNLLAMREPGPGGPIDLAGDLVVAGDANAFAGDLFV